MVKDDTSIKINDELKEIRKNEALLASLLENSSQPFGVGYPDGRLGLVNKAFEELTGYSREELKNIDWSEILTPHEFMDMENEELEELQRTGKPVKYEKEYIRKDGIRVSIELLVHLVKNRDNTPKYYYSFITDISERKKAEETLIETLQKTSQLNRTLVSLRHSSVALLHATDEESYMDDICRIIVDDCGYSMVWIGFTQEESKKVRPVAYAGFEEDYLKKLNITWDDTEHGHGPTGTAIRTGKPYICKNMLTDPKFKPWREEAIKRGYASSLVIPIISDNKAIGALNIYSKETNPFSEEEKNLLGELVDDISYGITSIRLRMAHDRAEMALQESEARFNEVLDNLSDAFLILDSKWRYVYVNAVAEKFAGRSNEEMLGKVICNVLPNFVNSIPYEQCKKTMKDKIPRTWTTKAVVGNIWSEFRAYPWKDGFSLFIRDISENKKAEESLKESEERYHSLFNNNHAVMLLINPDNGDIIDANPAATHFYGYNYNELVKMNINNINVLSKEEIHDKMQKSVLSQQNNFLFKHQLASGDIRDVDVYSGTIVLGGKKLLYSIVHDVTDRAIAQNKLKESNEELQSTTEELQVTNEELHQQEDKLLQTYNELKVSEERFRSIIENIQDAYMRADKEGTIIMASPSAARMYRFNSIQEMIGTSTPSYFKNSEDRDFAREKLKKYGKYNDYEVEARRNDDTFFWVSQNAQYYYDDHGKIQGSETIVRDITVKKVIEAALKKSEQSLADAQHIAHIGSWEWNIKTGEITWSNELYLIYRVDPNTFTPTLSSFGDYMHPDDEEYVNNHVDQLLTDGKLHNFDFRIVLDDGSIRVLNTLAEVAEFDKNGKPSIIMGINQDITERKEIELKLNENIKKLAQSNKELEEFAYITSHDLREPLRMITSFLQLLERRYKDQLDEDANEFIGFAVDGAKRLDAMTHDLLQYSRINREKREIKPVNFEHVLEEALLNLKVPIEESNAVITHDPLPTINGDEQLKIRLFQNLIGNAIKYRSQESPKIHISAKKEKNQYLFCIKDNGIGMSPKHLEQIFIIFKRLHTPEEYEGTGIGLAIAQKIVHQQGGNIWAESEPDKGTTFYFTLPNKK